ncbi:MAG: AraC family transcriptional regulator [bacterium]|nr:AraC family transcriptional regulator [bacterium]
MRIDPETSPDYVLRVNRAVDYILGHLDQPLKLDLVARAACFSPFHFHRIFRALMGETLSQFVKRTRLERAVSLLTHDPGRSLTDVAFACGFSSSSDFSRSFRQRYGVPPSAFDVDVFRAQRRADWQAPGSACHGLERLPPGENPDGFEVQLRRLPPRCVAYIRVMDSFRPGVVADAVGRLVEWAEERGLADGQWLGYMWDDPEIVAPADCRYDVGLEVADVTAAGEVGRLEFPAMLVAQVEVRGPIELEMRAIDWLFRTWLPRSSYVPTDQPCFEAWIGRPFAHGDQHFELLAQVPVERA